MFVTFGDLDDPGSLQEIGPRDFSAIFGAGTRLNSILISITDEPISGGHIEHVLKWLTLPRKQFLDLGGGENPLRIKRSGTTEFIGTNAFLGEVK